MMAVHLASTGRRTNTEMETDGDENEKGADPGSE